MKLRSVYWRDLVNEVRYWDALDLLRNLDEEMDRMRSGFTHWILTREIRYPGLAEPEGVMMLSPDVVEREDHIEIAFPALESVDRDKIDVEITDRDLFVVVDLRGERGDGIGWFHLRIPPELDAETCDAGLEGGRLKICIRRKPGIARRKVVVHY